MRSIKLILASLVLAAGLATVALPQPALAGINPNQSLCEGKGGVWDGSGCSQPGEEDRSVPGLFETIVNLFLFLIGAVAVIMLIVGSIRYITSGGDQKAITAAKDTILYAVVGIIVAFAAYAIVQFVLGAFVGSDSGGGGGGGGPGSPFPV